MEKEKKVQLPPQEFQVIFEKLEEAKKENKDIFILNSQFGSTLSEQIREIQEIVDSYSAPNTYTTFTKA